MVSDNDNDRYVYDMEDRREIDKKISNDSNMKRDILIRQWLKLSKII